MIDPKRIWTSSQLPSLPTVAVRLLELSRDTDTLIRDVVDIIKSDPALSAKILKAANSTYFGVRCEVKSLERAVPLLGTTVTTSLALSFSLVDATMQRGPLAEHYRQYWKQSLVHATAAESLAVCIAPAMAPEFFLGGLLQDIGRLAMLKTIPQEYTAVLNTADREGAALIDVESSHLGFDHAYIGGQLLEHWKLPPELIEAVRHHHEEVDALWGYRESADFSLYAASALAASVGEYFCTARKGYALDRSRRITERCFQFDESRLEAFLQEVAERIGQLAELFNVDVTDLGDPAEIMTQANEQLAQLALREHVASTQATLKHQVVEQQRKELEVRNRELEQQALHDPLTQLYNRRPFEEALQREVHRCLRTATPLGVLFLDIDHFKSINDTHGHAIGDAVLRHVADVLRKSVRASDVLARYGGEEFVILVNQPTERGFEKLAERIRQQVQETQFSHGNKTVPVTVSIGGALSIPGREDHLIGEVLLSTADACLYEAKRAGRNRAIVRSLVRDDDRRLMELQSARRFSRWLVAQRMVDVPTVSRALLATSGTTARVGEIAIQQGDLTRQQVEAVLAQQAQCGERFGMVAVRLGWLSWERLALLLAWQQENPKQLAAALIQQGSLSPTVALAALERYLQIHSHAAAASPVLAGSGTTPA
jgi:diguanylate cyclase (GGDEF)-like protein